MNKIPALLLSALFATPAVAAIPSPADAPCNQSAVRSALAGKITAWIISAFISNTNSPPPGRVSTSVVYAFRTSRATPLECRAIALGIFDGDSVDDSARAELVEIDFRVSHQRVRLVGSGRMLDTTMGRASELANNMLNELAIRRSH